MLDCEECTEKQSQKYLFSKKKFFIRYYWLKPVLVDNWSELNPDCENNLMPSAE